MDAEVRQKILLVDDSQTNLRLGKGILSAVYDAVTVPGAEKMYKFLSTHSVDLILLDIDMPEIDGWTAIKQLKSDPATADIPVVFMSGETDEASKQKGFSLGAVDFITKPLSAAVLLASVKKHAAK